MIKSNVKEVYITDNNTPSTTPPKAKGRGGFRPGAGRKNLAPEKERGTISIYGKKTELERLKSKAEKAGKTTSRYVLENLNCTDEQN